MFAAKCGLIVFGACRHAAHDARRLLQLEKEDAAGSISAADALCAYAALPYIETSAVPSIKPILV